MLFSSFFLKEKKELDIECLPLLGFVFAGILGLALAIGVLRSGRL